MNTLMLCFIFYNTDSFHSNWYGQYITDLIIKTIFVNGLEAE